MKLRFEAQRPVLGQQPFAARLHVLAVPFRLRRHAGKTHAVAQLIDKLRFVILEILENLFHARRIKRNWLRDASGECRMFYNFPNFHSFPSLRTYRAPREIDGVLRIVCWRSSSLTTA